MAGNLRAVARTSREEEDNRQLQELPPLREVVGTFGAPFAPLQKCDGDCDFDFECAGNLKCFHRVGFEAVPGCNGVGATTGMDFCYDEEDRIINEILVAPTGTPPISIVVPTRPPSPAVLASSEEGKIAVVNGFFSTPWEDLKKCEGT